MTKKYKQCSHRQLSASYEDYTRTHHLKIVHCLQDEPAVFDWRGFLSEYSYSGAHKNRDFHIVRLVRRKIIDWSFTSVTTWRPFFQCSCDPSPTTTAVFYFHVWDAKKTPVYQCTTPRTFYYTCLTRAINLKLNACVSSGERRTDFAVVNVPKNSRANCQNDRGHILRVTRTTVRRDVSGRSDHSESYKNSLLCYYLFDSRIIIRYTGHFGRLT